MVAAEVGRAERERRRAAHARDASSAIFTGAAPPGEHRRARNPDRSGGASLTRSMQGRVTVRRRRRASWRRARACASGSSHGAAEIVDALKVVKGSCGAKSRDLRRVRRRRGGGLGLSVGIQRVRILMLRHRAVKAEPPQRSARRTCSGAYGGPFRPVGDIDAGYRQGNHDDGSRYAKLVLAGPVGGGKTTRSVRSRTFNRSRRKCR